MLSPVLFIELFFDLLLARVLSLQHVVELADYRIEMPQLDQGLILVDAHLHNREGLLVGLNILKRGYHILEGLGSD